MRERRVSVARSPLARTTARSACSSSHTCSTRSGWPTSRASRPPSASVSAGSLPTSVTWLPVASPSPSSARARARLPPTPPTRSRGCRSSSARATPSARSAARTRCSAGGRSPPRPRCVAAAQGIPSDRREQRGQCPHVVEHGRARPLEPLRRCEPTAYPSERIPAARAACTPVPAVLDHDARRRAHTHLPGGVQVQVRRRLAVRDLGGANRQADPWTGRGRPRRTTSSLSVSGRDREVRTRPGAGTMVVVRSCERSHPARRPGLVTADLATGRLAVPPPPRPPHKGVLS